MDIFEFLSFICEEYEKDKKYLMNPNFRFFFVFHPIKNFIQSMASLIKTAARSLTQPKKITVLKLLREMII